MRTSRSPRARRCSASASTTLRARRHRRARPHGRRRAPRRRRRRARRRRRPVLRRRHRRLDGARRFDDLKAARRVRRRASTTPTRLGPAARDPPRLLDGVDAADSVACSLHKMLGVALQAAVFVARAAGATRTSTTRVTCTSATSSTRAWTWATARSRWPLLPPASRPAPTPALTPSRPLDPQCGRKPDALKTWLTFKALGDTGLAARVDRCFDLAAHLAERVLVGRRLRPRGAAVVHQRLLLVRAAADAPAAAVRARAA